MSEASEAREETSFIRFVSYGRWYSGVVSLYIFVVRFLISFSNFRKKRRRAALSLAVKV